MANQQHITSVYPQKQLRAVTKQDFKVFLPMNYSTSLEQKREILLAGDVEHSKVDIALIFFRQGLLQDVQKLDTLFNNGNLAAVGALWSNLFDL